MHLGTVQRNRSDCRIRLSTPDPNDVETNGEDHDRIFFYTNFYASDAVGEDVPYALCRTNHANTAIMIPGKNTCYSGWKVEYHGYLSSGYYGNDAATTYVCVDIKPEYIIGGVNQNLGKLFFEVLTKCGSLKCPPYKNNYPLTCVVSLVTTEEKRLLLNDPDVLLNRLNRLESVVAVLNNTVQQQAITIQKQEKTIKQLQDYATTTQSYAGGGLYSESGGASEYVCLPPDPNYEKTSGPDHGRMYGPCCFARRVLNVPSRLNCLGTTYIRWGRKQCSNNNTELVYSGFAGGGYYGESGSAAEYVCLPPDPNYVKTSGGADNGHMYGAEFNSNFFASNANGEDVPCALCRTNPATSEIMIPGKNTCYSGWTLEYHGYLASGYYGHNVASAYVCVDIKPEYVMGGVDFHYGKLFFDVLTKCGSLKCPPYINNYPLTCVVCSK
ncbi:Hypothetical predicted protein [Mytilus galloprovincialis]|uniref:Uncharacterized protein n=1 Tax=Mytilus galloprovincialis TaxID=29158 RepID=A0A8B6FC10_MYTGA|nr:Hypothetical predicted protein [Mytilus galloprovincialis]